MEKRKYYINQDELGLALKEVLDQYISEKISNKKLEKIILEIVNFNSEKFFVGGNIAVRVKRKIGKKRLSIIEKILKEDKK